MGKKVPHLDKVHNERQHDGAVIRGARDSRSGSVRIGHGHRSAPAVRPDAPPLRAQGALLRIAAMTNWQRSGTY